MRLAGELVYMWHVCETDMDTNIYTHTDYNEVKKTQKDSKAAEKKEGEQEEGEGEGEGTMAEADAEPDEEVGGLGVEGFGRWPNTD